MKKTCIASLLKAGVFTLASTVLALISASCSSETPKKPSQSEMYPKLRDYSLQLNVVSTRVEYYAGEENGAMTFSMKNIGLKPLLIAEWHVMESANLNLFYAPCAAGEDPEKIPDEKWKQSPTFDKEDKGSIGRLPLALNPNNSVLIKVPLSFLKDLKDEGGKKMTYAVRGELNLISVKLKSKPFMITVK